jgi:hypothetical protein
MHVQDQVRAVLLAVVNQPIQFRPTGVVFQQPSVEGHANTIETEIRNFGQILFGDEICVDLILKVSGFVATNQLGQFLHQRCLRRKSLSENPPFPEQPSAEVHPTELQWMARGIHKLSVQRVDKYISLRLRRHCNSTRKDQMPFASHNGVLLTI